MGRELLEHLATHTAGRRRLRRLGGNDDCLEASYSASHRARKRRTLGADCDRIRIQTDTASKLGLVVNEFVTNAFKHGHSGDEDCTVRVTAYVADGVLTIEVADGGPGLPEDFDIARIRGLGMRLVRFVAGSLGGESGARNGAKGAVFFVRIPLPDAS